MRRATYNDAMDGTSGWRAMSSPVMRYMVHMGVGADGKEAGRG
jgi:hypothetical protein